METGLNWSGQAAPNAVYVIQIQPCRRQQGEVQMLSRWQAFMRSKLDLVLSMQKRMLAQAGIKKRLWGST